MEIEYISKTASTAIVEAELHISQFDFKPLQIRVMGSGKYEGVDMQLTRKKRKRIGRGGDKTLELDNQDLVETQDGFRQKKTKKELYSDVRYSQKSKSKKFKVK